MVLEQLGASWTTLAAVVLSGLLTYAAVILLTRLAGALGPAVLYALQYLVANLRRRDLLLGLVDNRPILLMAGSEVLEPNLRHAPVGLEELWAQLRMAGVHRREQVQAVVMETTGDTSVLRAGQPLDAELMRDVRGAEALR